MEKIVRWYKEEDDSFFLGLALRLGKALRDNTAQLLNT